MTESPDAWFTQSLLASLGEGIILYDTELRYRLWNPFMEELTGLPAAEVLGRRAVEVFPHLREHGVDRLLVRALAGEAIHAPDVPYHVPASGRRGWVRATYRPHRDAEGRILGVLGIVRDITQGKQAEAELRRATREWEETFDTVPDAIALLDAEHRIVRVNRAMARRLGLTPEACVGRTCYEAVHGLAEPPDFCPHVATCRDGREHTAEVHEPRLGGDFLVTTTPRFDAEGRCLGCIHVARDITERKRVEVALRESQADLSRAQAVAHVGSWRLDVARQRLHWSQEAYRIFGMPVGTPLTYETFLAAVHPEDREYVHREWTAALGGRAYDIEHRILVAGKVKWVREQAELEWDAQGRLRGGFGTVQDITDRKEAEAERHRLALFPEQNPAPVLRVGRDGGLLYANAASQPLLAAWGCEVGKSLSGAACAALALPLGTDEDDKVEREVSCGGRVFSLVAVRFKAEGYINLYGRDITARKRAEDALAAHEQLLNAILEQAAVSLVAVDAEGRFTLVNRAARSLAQGDPRGKGVADIDALWGSPLDRAGTPVGRGAGPLSRALRGDVIAGVEIRFTREDGSMVDVLMSAAPIRDAAGAIVGAVGAAVDIGERRQAEERLRQALRDNQTLLREVHHRTKNNLQMLADLLYLKAEATEGAEGKRILEDSYLRIFSFARLHEQLYLSMRSGRIGLSEYLEGVFGEFQALHPELGVRFEPSAVPIELDLDRTIHTGLIVNELLTNAAKHGAPRTGGLVGLGLELLADRVRLRVWDNGPGLPGDFAIEHSPSLGLRLVGSLAQRLGAEMRVENRNGALFTLSFPLRGDAPIEPR